VCHSWRDTVRWTDRQTYSVKHLNCNNTKCSAPGYVVPDDFVDRRRCRNVLLTYIKTALSQQNRDVLVTDISDTSLEFQSIATNCCGLFSFDRLSFRMWILNGLVPAYCFSVKRAYSLVRPRQGDTEGQAVLYECESLYDFTVHCQSVVCISACVCVKVVLPGGADSDGFGTAICPCPCHHRLSSGSSTNSRSVSLRHCQSCALKVNSTSLTWPLGWLCVIECRVVGFDNSAKKPTEMPSNCHCHSCRCHDGLMIPGTHWGWDWDPTPHYCFYLVQSVGTGWLWGSLNNMSMV